MKNIDISNNKLTDDSMSVLLKSVSESKLESLNLSGNAITDKSVNNIGGILKTNKYLKHLDLTNNLIQSRLMKNKINNYLTHINVTVWTYLIYNYCLKLTLLSSS